MFSTAPSPRSDFADTRSLCTDTARAAAYAGRVETADAIELIASADAADLHLLRLVGCAALATVVLALATSFAV